jgi:multicomponent Na+:H+ antiporter subunit C
VAPVTYLPYAVAVWVFLVGLYGVVTSRNLIHLALCLTVMQSATYVLLLAIGYKNGGTAPIFRGIKLGHPAVDPVVQALTLTDIVVSVTVIALILALALDVHKESGSVDPDEIADFSG